MANTTPDNQLEFDLGQDEKETDVEIPMEAGEENDNSSTFVETKDEKTTTSDKQSEELDAVSENVQKRISKLTAKMREAERREQAALEYARGIQAQATNLQQKLVVTDHGRLTEAKARLDTQQATLKAIIKRAREEGDIDTETEAQEKLGQLAYDQRQVSEWLEGQRQNIQRAQQQPEPQAYQPPPAPVQQREEPSPQATEWARRNSWFGKDKAMTYAAWGIHASLVQDEMLDPETDEYYTELDNRIRNEFPHKFKQPNQQSQRNVPPVAPANRGSGTNNSARRTVRLSPSQIAIAKKLGVPLEEYAKYVKE
jgi:hypothetical protein